MRKRIEITMTEIKQSRILEQLVRKEISTAAAAAGLGVSTRQVRRKLKVFLEEGTFGLIHKNRGKTSPRKLKTRKKNRIIKIIKENYPDFGPTFATEKLAENHDIIIHPESLRRIMIAAGIWQKRKKRNTHRKWRKPMDNRGAMAQLDGSEHDWFEGRGERCTLLKFADDATSEYLWMEFAKSESTHSVMTATKHYFEKHGKPLSIYADCGKTFRVNINNPDGERSTQYKRALKDLGVTLKNAYSPQAKGRIERSFQTDQDRLVKELRLHNISNIEDANSFLMNYYMPKYSKKYAKKPDLPADLHQSIVGYDLNHIFSVRSERQLHNDFTVHYKNRLFQLTKHQPTLLCKNDRIMIFENLNGQISLSIRQCKLDFIEIFDQKDVIGHQPAVNANKNVYKKSTETPWRRSNHYLFAK